MKYYILHYTTRCSCSDENEVRLTDDRIKKHLELRQRKIDENVYSGIKTDFIGILIIDMGRNCVPSYCCFKRAYLSGPDHINNKDSWWKGTYQEKTDALKETDTLPFHLHKSHMD
jgi:hypothetical protein